MVYLMESLRAAATLMVSSRGVGPLNFDFARSNLKAPTQGSAPACLFFWLKTMVELSKRKRIRARFTGPPSRADELNARKEAYVKQGGGGSFLRESRIDFRCAHLGSAPGKLPHAVRNHAMHV